MNLETEIDQPFELEPERYEFQESGWNFDLGRRDFLKILGGGLLVFCLGQDDEAQEPGRPQRRGGGGPGRGMMRGEQPRQIDAWLHIGENGIGDGVDRQGRGRPERPHLADDGRRR